MVKVVGVVAVGFAVAWGTSGLLGGVLGGAADAAGLGMMGLTLFASSQLFPGKLGGSATAREPAAQE